MTTDKQYLSEREKGQARENIDAAYSKELETLTDKIADLAEKHTLKEKFFDICRSVTMHYGNVIRYGYNQETGLYSFHYVSSSYDYGFDDLTENEIKYMCNAWCGGAIPAYGSMSRMQSRINIVGLNYGNLNDGTGTGAIIYNGQVKVVAFVAHFSAHSAIAFSSLQGCSNVETFIGQCIIANIPAGLTKFANFNAKLITNANVDWSASRDISYFSMEFTINNQKTTSLGTLRIKLHQDVYNRLQEEWQDLVEINNNRVTPITFYV